MSHASSTQLRSHSDEAPSLVFTQVWIMQTRKDGIRGKIIKTCISKSCGFNKLKTLFLENYNLLGTILQTHLPARARVGTRTHTPLSGPVHSSCPSCFFSPSRPWSDACVASPTDQLDVTHPWPTAAFSPTTVVFQILLVIVSNTFRPFFPGVSPSLMLHINFSLRQQRQLSQAIYPRKHSHF